MHPLFPPLSLRLALLPGALALMLLGSSCESVVPWGEVSTLPSEIPYHASTTRVLWDRGRPQRITKWYAALPLPEKDTDPCAAHPPATTPDSKKAALNVLPPNQIGTIWHYEEDWHRPHSFWADNWASWDLYFNTNNKLEGWRLVEPLGSETRARQHFGPTEVPASDFKFSLLH